MTITRWRDNPSGADNQQLTREVREVQRLSDEPFCKKGDAIVRSAWRHVEADGNDLPAAKCGSNKMDNTMMRMQFSAAAQNNLEKTSGDSLASTLAQLSGVINGRPVAAAG